MSACELPGWGHGRAEPWPQAARPACVLQRVGALCQCLGHGTLGLWFRFFLGGGLSKGLGG